MLYRYRRSAFLKLITGLIGLTFLVAALVEWIYPVVQNEIPHFSWNLTNSTIAFERTSPPPELCGQLSVELRELNLLENTPSLSYFCDRESDCGGLGDNINGINNVVLSSLLLRTSVSIRYSRDQLFAIGYQPLINGLYATAHTENALMIDQLGAEDLVIPDIVHDSHKLLREGISTVFVKSRWPVDRTILAFNSYTSILNEIYGLNPHSFFITGCVMSSLFRPTLLLETALLNITDKLFPLGIENYVVVGVHLRLGQGLGVNFQDILVRNHFDDANRFISCAHSLLQQNLCHKRAKKWSARGRLPVLSYLDRPVKILLLSDSSVVKEEQKRLNPELVLTPDTPIAHVGFAQAIPDYQLLSMLAEHWLFGDSDCAVISRSGFSESAASMGFIEHVYYGYHDGQECKRLGNPIYKPLRFHSS